jgi:eukaryotic-like serine/threonine-protein kinase
VLAVAGLAFLVGQRLTASHPPGYTQLTFDPGVTGPARFTHDGDAVVYSAAWNGGAVQLFWQRASSNQARPLNLDADVMGIADSGDMAIILKHHYQASWLASGTLARLPVEGGTPRPILDEVYWADITRDGKDFAVVRSSGGKQRLEFPIGNTLYETQGWITDVRIAPDGKHIAFLDHPMVPDDIGAVGLVDLEGNYRRLTRQYASCHGLAWTPTGRRYGIRPAWKARNLDCWRWIYRPRHAR